MRNILSVIALSFLLLGASSARSLDESELLVYLKELSFPLFQTNNPEEEIQCLGWNGVLSKNRTVSFYATAAHCEPWLRARNENGMLFRRFPIQMEILSGAYDQRVLLKPYCSGKLPYGFSQSLEPNGTYYALGHQSPKDRFENLGLIRLRFIRSSPEDSLVFTQICTGDECQLNMRPGVSGSPVIDGAGLVVGSYRGYPALAPYELQVSPIDILDIFFRSASQTNGQIHLTRHCPRKD